MLVVDEARRLDATSPDLDAALALIRAAFAAMEGRIDPPSSVHALTRETLAASEVWVIGAPPVAAIALTPRPQVLYLGKLAVAEAARGRGLARRLIDLAEDRARALGRRWLELQTRVELTENHAAFGALGFSEVARTAHAGYDRPTSITFRRLVTPPPEGHGSPHATRQDMP